MIKFYSTNCPKCRILKKIMDDKNIEYTEVNDEEMIMQVAEKYNEFGMPFGEINNKFLNTKELQKWITEQE